MGAAASLTTAGGIAANASRTSIGNSSFQQAASINSQMSSAAILNSARQSKSFWANQQSFNQRLFSTNNKSPTMHVIGQQSSEAGRTVELISPGAVSETAESASGQSIAAATSGGNPSGPMPPWLPTAAEISEKSEHPLTTKQQEALSFIINMAYETAKDEDVQYAIGNSRGFLKGMRIPSKENNQATSNTMDEAKIVAALEDSADKMFAGDTVAATLFSEQETTGHASGFAAPEDEPECFSNARNAFSFLVVIMVTAVVVHKTYPNIWKSLKTFVRQGCTYVWGFFKGSME
mmetsp:Transcript_16569/g.24715  ORF Transcript_16569/g.24715 Transcript_16569/m.24715 type:complete len:292 (-) Transcript_16569:129-1004(-)|eukprot:CAMPEP_0201552856 /NCGR_PEP_ID=MMETSP0173_2-20130828/18694_1 /ASSEMBLY_ACC=CAM_ASM_000268 /TAXON_ID=218659 /ORGANISM="Vexillifera sp., Strain DIVA3 564/2" /LENGTH=291 /DNA_ID=CAMNT_0047963417 /DNA_START=32 /DNA_END=907 /DNA_ORIENTATION=+